MSAPSSISSSTSFPMAQPAATPVAIATPTTAQPTAAPVAPNPNAGLIENIRVWSMARAYVQLNMLQDALAEVTEDLTQNLAQFNTLQTTINTQNAHVNSLEARLKQSEQSSPEQQASLGHQLLDQAKLLNGMLRLSNALGGNIEESNETINQLQFTINQLQTNIQVGLSKVSPEIQTRVAALQALPRDEFQNQMNVLQDQMPAFVIQSISSLNNLQEGQTLQEAVQAAQTAMAEGMAQLEHPDTAQQE